jgi:hypothetical protein
VRFLVQVFYNSQLGKADILVKNLGVGLPGIVAKVLGGEKASKATHNDVTVAFQPFGPHDRHSSDVEIFIHAPGHDCLTGLNSNSKAAEMAEALVQGFQSLMSFEGFVCVYIGKMGRAPLSWSDDMDPAK